MYTVLVSCSDELAVHLYPLICLQRQVAKLLRSFYHWSLLRNNSLAPILQRLTSRYGGQGRINEGGNGEIAPGSPLQGSRDDFLFVLNKILVRKIVVIQKRYKNTTLYSDVALSTINDFFARMTFYQF